LQRAGLPRVPPKPHLRRSESDHRIAGGASGTGWTVPRCGHPDRAWHGHHLRSHARQRSGHLPERGVPGFRDSRTGARHGDDSHDARVVRATKAPARDTVLAATPAARRGSELFDAIGCATCHVRTLVTAAAGTAINGGTDTIPPALGEKAFHPFGDFLLHNVGTGDGIVMA